MITRLEIDGFKSFKHFKITFRPFQVLIGPNGVGKSNIFDAISLLSRLAQNNNLYDAFLSNRNRGDILEQFHVDETDQPVREMQLAVEMLIPLAVTDDFGVTSEVSDTRLRYELHIERRQEGEFERLYVTHERLKSIRKSEDRWLEDGVIPKDKQAQWIRRNPGRNKPYIDTEEGKITLAQDKRQGRKLETPLGHVERTILSSVNSAEYPTVYAARQEMASWRFLQFNPYAMRKPASVFSDTELLPDGSNLAAVLQRMRNKDEFALNDVSMTMTRLVPGVRAFDVQHLKEKQEFLINMTTAEDDVFSSRVVSDGTLRLLALVTLRHDPAHHGLICFEEPENGVQPLRLHVMINVLRDLVTDFRDEDDADQPLRQMIVNTHSPAFLSYVVDERKLESEEVQLIYMPRGRSRVTRVGALSDRMLEVPEEDAEGVRRFTKSEVEAYLHRDQMPEGVS